MLARVSRYELAYRVLAGSSRQAYHFQNPTSSRKVQVTLPLSSCHVSKCSKVIESMEKRGTVAEISNARAKSLSTHELCHICARQIL